MSPNTIAIGSDHAGLALKRALKEALNAQGYEVIDLGTGDEASVDYPDYARAVVGEIELGRAERGVLVCGTGIGMSIAANRHPGIRAALCYNDETAALSRQHNDANVLVIGGRMTDENDAKKWLNTFLVTEFEGGRHQRRVDKLG